MVKYYVLERKQNGRLIARQVSGRQVVIDGLVLMTRRYYHIWSVDEPSTGMQVATGANRSEAVENARQKIDRVKAHLLSCSDLVRRARRTIQEASIRAER